MKTKSFAIASMALAVALGMVVCAPLAGCSGCSTNRESNVIQKSAGSKSPKKKQVDRTAAQKVKDSAAGGSTKTAQEETSAVTDAKTDGCESKSSTSTQATPSKAGTGKLTESNSNESKPTGSQKKWVPEQGHWETDYSQVWVPNMVYTRHERWIYSVCHAVFNSSAEMNNHTETTNGDAQHPNGASSIDDSYTTSEDQGHYEQQATGQHWVVDVAGHWE